MPFSFCRSRRAACAAALLFALPAAFAWTTKPVKLLVPAPAGGTMDVVARLVADQLAQELGQPVVVDNKPGAGTLIGAQDVAKAPSDGHTLLYTIVVTHTQNPHLYSKLPYDPFKDFTPLMQVARSATVLVVNKDSPFNSLREMVTYARNNPGKLNFASYSQGSTSHLNAEMLMLRSNTQMVHIPYKGTPDATRALMAGDVQFYFDGTATAVEGAKSGRFKLLAVAADKRLSVLPDLPTMTEAGVDGIDIVGWQGFFAPGNMPPALAKKIADAMANTLKTPEVSQLILNQGNEVSGAGPEEFARIVKRDYDRWGAVIKRLNLKLD